MAPSAGVDDHRTCYRMARSLVELGLNADALVL